MFKRMSLAGAFAVFVSVSGASAFVTHLTVSKVEPASVRSANRAQFAARPLISHASFKTLQIDPANAPTIPRDYANTVRQAAPIDAVDGDIDLGETFIFAGDAAVK